MSHVETILFLVVRRTLLLLKRGHYVIFELVQVLGFIWLWTATTSSFILLYSRFDIIDIYL